jgi:hypothetical protein
MENDSDMEIDGDMELDSDMEINELQMNQVDRRRTSSHDLRRSTFVEYFWKIYHPPSPVALDVCRRTVLAIYATVIAGSGPVPEENHLRQIFRQIYARGAISCNDKVILNSKCKVEDRSSIEVAMRPHIFVQDL